MQKKVLGNIFFPDFMYLIIQGKKTFKRYRSNWHLKERFPGLSLKGTWKLLKTENYRVPPRAYSSVVSGIRIGRRELAGAGLYT